MRIGIDLQVIPKDTSQLTGVSHYALMLKKYLERANHNHELIFFERRERKLPFWDAHVRDAAIFRKAELDLLHSPAYTTPLFYRGETVITIHDLAIYKHPEWFPPRQWFSTKLLVPISIKRASHIITISESSKKDIIELFGRELALRPVLRSFSEGGSSKSEVGDKISVTPLGVEKSFFKSATNHKLPTTSPYILCVATLEPRKNITRLIQAYKQLPSEILDKYDLLIAGGKGWKTESIDSEIQSVKSSASTRLGEVGEIRNKVRLLGAVDSNQLIALYQGASLFVFLSLYEGFGLPVLEAMAAGVPVVSSNVSSIPEFAKNYAILVNPCNVGEITKAMQKVLTSPNLASKMSQRGVERASEYTWEKTAQSTLKAYESLG